VDVGAKRRTLGFAAGLGRRGLADAAAGLAAGALWWASYGALGFSPLGALLLLGNVAAAVGAGLVLDAALGLARGTPAALGPGRIGALFGALVVAPALAIAADRFLPGENPVSATPRGALALAGVVALSVAAMAVAARLARLVFRRRALRWGATAAAGTAILAVTAIATPREWARRLAAPPRPEVGAERVATAASGRLTIVGVDGGDWRILLPLVRAGRLPAFERLLEEGAAAVCRSVLDDVGEIASPVVWTSLATGFSPERHGIDGWSRAISLNRRVPALWGVVRGAGLRSVVLNVPGTYPPEPIAGYMVAGMPLPEPVLANVPGFFFSADPERSPWARFEPKPAPRDGEDLVLRIPIPAVPDPARASRLGVSHLLVRHCLVAGLARPDLAWLFPREETAVVRLRALEGGTRLLATIASDDGGAPLSRVEFDAGALSPPVRFTRSGLLGRLKALSATEIFVSPLSLSVESGGYDTDRAVTAALESALGPLVADAPPWLPVVGDPDLLALWSERTLDSARRRAAAAARAFDTEVPDATLRFVVFTETDRAQHALWPYLEPTAYSPAPDPALVASLGDVVPDLYEIVDEFLARLLAAREPGDVIAVVSDHGFQAGSAGPPATGDHRIEGIFLALGPGVARGSGVPADESALPDISILDVAPSLLHWTGFPVAAGADGRVRVEIVAGGDAGLRRFEIPAGFDARGGAVELGAEARAQVRALGYAGGEPKR